MIRGLNEKADFEHRYITLEGLDEIIPFADADYFNEGAFDFVAGKLTAPVPPEADDIVRLHRTVRQRKCFTVLEFGTGHSTLALADALAKNERDWNNLPQRPEIRNRFMFQLFTVDASQKWIDNTRSRLPEHLRDRVHFHHSEVEVGTFNGRMCHYYKNLPDIVPDFIYLDGPAPKDVQGSVNGLTFHCDERTVMSADPLLMEPTFLPGTFILVDGRTNNARFLANNFQREYNIRWDREADVTTFELCEERLGKYNVLGSDFFQGRSVNPFVAPNAEIGSQSSPTAGR